MNSLVLTIDKINEISRQSAKAQRSAINELERILLEQKQADMKLDHVVHAGIYARALYIPKGCLLTGAIYKFDHLQVLAKGCMAISGVNCDAQIYDGFSFVPAFTGKKQAGYALEDSIWVTFHAVGNNSKAVDDIQDDLVVNSFAELDDFYAEVNRLDYKMFLTENNLTEAIIQDMVKASDFDDSFPYQKFDVSLGKSSIEGMGMFAEKEFTKGEHIMPARINGNRTHGGRYINHAVRPNCEMRFDGADLQVVAIRFIDKGDELTVNYRNTLVMRLMEGDL